MNTTWHDAIRLESLRPHNRDCICKDCRVERSYRQYAKLQKSREANRNVRLNLEAITRLARDLKEKGYGTRDN